MLREDTNQVPSNIRTDVIQSIKELIGTSPNSEIPRSQLMKLLDKAHVKKAHRGHYITAVPLHKHTHGNATYFVLGTNESASVKPTRPEPKTFAFTPAPPPAQTPSARRISTSAVLAIVLLVLICAAGIGALATSLPH